MRPDRDMEEKLLAMEMGRHFLTTFMNSDFLVVEEENGDFAGVAGVGGIFHVGGIFVREDRRGRGLSSKLNKARDDELRRRNYSFFIGTTYAANPNSKEISSILKSRDARPVFAFSIHEGFTTTLFIQEFNTWGRILGSLLGFFNSRFGTLCLAMALKTTQKFWKGMFLANPDDYQKISVKRSLKNFVKVTRPF